MPWMTDQQGKLLLRFLEIEPPTNNFGNIKTRYLCFYSSELKSLKQTAEYLKTIQASVWNDLNSNQLRYTNTLVNLGLVTKSDDETVNITSYGQKLVDFLSQNGKEPDDLGTDAVLAVSYEKIILHNLIQIVNRNEFEKSSEFGKKILFELQSLKTNLTEQEYLDICNDFDRLLFIQIINSSGTEIRRFFNLNEAEQRDAYSAWNNLCQSSNFPENEPTDFIEKMAYFYTRPISKNTIQGDIKYRLSNCIKAYQELESEGIIDIPIVSRDYKVISSKSSTSAANEPNSLPIKNPRQKLDIPNQLIISGCPGSGKSRFIQDLLSSDQDAQVTMITMHPDYTYSDLVGCYKPVPVYESHDNIKTAAGLPFKNGSPKINYEFVPGPLIEAYVKALKNPNYNVVLVIEEINRTNCNSLFGDFFQLLDRSQTGESVYEICAMPDLRDYLVMKGINADVKLPENLYLMGTMNSADQGVFPLDSAFRRRWSFEYIGYKTPCMYDQADKNLTYGGKVVSWDELREKINKVLSSLGIHEDKLIGPYFLSKDELLDPKSIQNKLFLYLWDDVLRFQRNELMDFDSFADLAESWNGANGTPLKIDMD